MANEVRLIDANAVVESLTKFTPNGWGKDVSYIRSQWAMAVKIKDNFMKSINEAPTVDAVEVVHGEWIECEGTVCSVCNKHFFTDGPLAVANYRANYCPNCGARMDGGVVYAL